MKATPKQLALMRKALEEEGPLCWRISYRKYTPASSEVWDHFCSVYIMGALAPLTFYSEWVAQQRPGFEDNLVLRESGRTAWLKAMIAAAESGQDLPATPSLPPELEVQHAQA